MRKVLSLKKTSSAATSKNQKSITHFFKNTNVVPSEKQVKLLAQSESSRKNGLDKKLTKRRASSPVLIENVEILDDESSSKSTKDISQNTPKKFKIDVVSTKKSKNSPQKSPEKENRNKIMLELNNHTREINNEKLSDNAMDRLPLTPIKDQNSEEMNDKNKSSSDVKKDHVKSNENHSKIMKGRSVTPKKVLNFDDTESKMSGNHKNTPKKSLTLGSHCRSRVATLKTPEKLTEEELSPSKSGSTTKTQEFSPNTLDGFGDQWDMADIDENEVQDLDLSTMQRCEILAVTQHQDRLELRLKNASNNKGTLFVEGVWLDTPLSPGEVVSVLAARSAAGSWFVGTSAGLLALRPDHLLSCTSVVAGVFCRRRAVLQERFKGLDAGNTAMTIGILIHELVQKALTESIMEVGKLRAETERIIKESIHMLYDAGIREEEARGNMEKYLQPLAEFMRTYVAKPSVNKQNGKKQWDGHVDRVVDIEENVCCPQLGLKGKIDATLEVTIHQKNDGNKTLVPLELKSGMASGSAEHRGQLILYGMMLAALRGDDPTTAPGTGLLLYLKEKADVRAVECGYGERRDLMLLRNQLVQYLAPPPHHVDTEQLTDIEDAACVLQQRLPEPVHHHSACAKCPYLTLCQLHLWHTDGPSVSDTHPLSKLRDTALAHLTRAHIDYFLHWAALLRIEERTQASSAPLSALWTDTPDKRAKRGTCAANLKLKSVEPSHDRFLHCFVRQIKEIDSLSSNNKCTSGPQEGDFSIVSLDGRPWVAAGVVTKCPNKEIHILLERDLSRRLKKETVFHIDTYESYASTVNNLTNLGMLLEDSERSATLRRLIIDKSPAEWEAKLPRAVGALGARLMRALNIEQQRAVLRALAARDYALLRGLPGTGKTQTVSVLIAMLVGLRRRVLVTAHTHSAVDTVLARLPATIKVLRLGPSSRVSPALRARCEETLAASCAGVAELEELYDSMDVVGVTCLGAGHSLLARAAFDVCVVDEATQVLQPTVLRPLLWARRLVLVGDPDQLPPVVRSRAARRLGMEESLFHRLMCSDNTVTLGLQYRMNAPLAALANTLAYRGALKCAHQDIADATLAVHTQKLNAEPAWLQTACSPDPALATLFVDVSSDAAGCRIDKDKNCSSVSEACVVLAVVDALIRVGIPPEDIGVISPYRDQVSLLRRALGRRGVEGSTVDQFQGRDKSVVLYSCAKTEGNLTAAKEGEILNDQRRLAVSVTRAKHKLLVIGHALALQRYLPIQRLIQACTPLSVHQQHLNDVFDKYAKEFE